MPVTDLALAVELGDAAPLVGAELDAGHVAQAGPACRRSLFRTICSRSLGAAEVAAAAHHELGLGQLDHAAADVDVGGADRLADLARAGCRSASAGRGSTTTLYCRTKPPTLATSATPCALASAIAHVPILRRAQLGQRCAWRPSRRTGRPSRRPWRRGRASASRRAADCARHAAQILEHARARPVDVGAVLEDDVDEADAEEGEAAHDARPRHASACAVVSGIGDLVLDHLRRLARRTRCRR